jgi:hypothetical protein
VVGPIRITTNDETIGLMATKGDGNKVAYIAVFAPLRKEVGIYLFRG